MAHMLSQTFLSDASHVPLNIQGRPSCPILPLIDRLSKQVLSHYPTDMLVLGNLTPPRHMLWRTRVTSTDRQPKLILEFWEPYWIMKDTGPMAQAVVIQWSNLGYETTHRTFNGL
jgi:hypothetical protein